MMVSNHFDVRWVDGYSAVSDVPSSLASAIEKLAAELPSSHDRIELAVRDVRRSDGTTTWVGLLRFVVVVSSVPRPLGFLHAAVLPSGYCMDPLGWRAVVERRYGDHPEETIRELYEELAESTRDIGRDRLRALAIRIEDLRDLIEPFEEPDALPTLPRTYTRPGSRPPKGLAKATPTPVPAGPPKRPSSSMLPLSGRTVLPEPSPEPPLADELQDTEQALANDVTQPMEAPSTASSQLSGELPHRKIVEKAPRAWWVAGAAGMVLAALLGALGWLAHRHVVLIKERDRLREELATRHQAPDVLERTRAELERVKAELAEERKTKKPCIAQVEDATQECKASLADARNLSRLNSDQAERLREEVRLHAAELQEAKRNLAQLKTDLNTALTSKDRAEQVTRDAQAETKQLQNGLTQRSELLRALCGRIQSTPGGGKPPKECQGIK